MSKTTQYSTFPHAPINISEQYGKILNELEKAHIYTSQLEAKASKRDLRLESQLTDIKTQLTTLMNQ